MSCEICRKLVAASGYAGSGVAVRARLVAHALIAAGKTASSGAFAYAERSDVLTRVRWAHTNAGEWCLVCLLAMEGSIG